MQRQQAPFRAEVVGSFLRPDDIKVARQQFSRGEITAPQLRAVEDDAIRRVVEQQCACGLHVVTDGEFRRAWWHFDFFDGLQGVERYDSQQGIQFNGVQTKAHGVRVTGKLAFGEHPMLEDFRYLKSISGNAQPKMTIPSPSVLHFRGGRKDIDASVYPDLEAYFDDLATTWRDAIHAFYAAGCRYLQLDDTVWAYLCSDAQRQQIRERGDCPDALARIYADVFFLEYDNDRSGDFAPLRFIRPGHQQVVLGLVTTKNGELENPEGVKARLQEAAHYVDKAQICLSPQCGFASTEEGNTLTEAQQWNKIKLITEIAQQVW